MRHNDYTPPKHNDSATRPLTSPAATDTKPQQATTPSEETPPPVPPRTRNISSSSSSVEGAGTEKPLKSAISEDYEMYGWSPEAEEQPQLDQKDERHAQTETYEEPQTLKEGPQTLVEEPQTLKEAPVTFTEAPTTLHEPEKSEQELEKHAAAGSPESGSDEYFIVKEELSSPDEEEVPDGDGAIRPYIRFDKQFPVDLSWSDIPVDPLSS